MKCCISATTDCCKFFKFLTYKSGTYKNEGGALLPES
jgi:hypothetical protein